MTDKPIIFLDIDGPMIPERAFIFNSDASFSQDLDAMCLNVLRAILDETGAQIVFNTTHNTALRPDGVSPGLLNQFAKAGFHVGSEIHNDCATLYPNVDRLTAIMEWINRNPVIRWVALDDVPIDHTRAFLVDGKHGIGWGEYRHCIAFLSDEYPAPQETKP